MTFALAGALLSLVLPFVPEFRRFFYSGGDLGPFIYFLFVFLSFWIFPFRVASLSWLILAVGDATAPLGSFLPHGIRLRRSSKTLSGFLLYTATTFVAASLASPYLPAGPSSAADLFFACLAASLLDAQSRRPWDNLLPPLAAALVLALP
jgi:dolichol kinase